MLSLHLYVFCVVPIQIGITRVGSYRYVLYYFLQVPTHVYIIIITSIVILYMYNIYNKPYIK